MKKNIIFVFFTLFLLSVTGYSQNQNEYNQVNANGKKQGIWIVYLDELWGETDSSDATCYFYTYYDDGVNTIPFGKYGKKKWELNPNISENSEPIELNGEYKWTDKNGTVQSIHKFENGQYISCKEFDKSGKLEQHFDYDNQYGENPHTYRVVIYKNNEEIRYVMRNGPQGWMLYNDPGVGSEDDNN